MRISPTEESSFNKKKKQRCPNVKIFSFADVRLMRNYVRMVYVSVKVIVKVKFFLQLLIRKYYPIIFLIVFL